MNKTEMTNTIYEWLKSDEKMTTVSTGDGDGKRTAMFVKTPCTKKGYEGVFMVISGDITYMEDWCSTTNFSRAGFWLPDREVFLENDVHSYNFGEENPHFLSESKLIQEVMKNILLMNRLTFPQMTWMPQKKYRQKLWTWIGSMVLCQFRIGTILKDMPTLIGDTTISPQTCASAI